VRGGLDNGGCLQLGWAIDAMTTATATKNADATENVRQIAHARRRKGTVTATSQNNNANSRGNTFAGVVISATQVDSAQRARLEEVVRLMGGELSGSFDRSMSALIAGGVGSEKYLAAKRWQVPVVEPAWVEACFRARQLVDVSKYEIGPFYKLRFSVTGWNDALEVKNEIVDLICANGGQYAASMRPESTTHLVAESFVGPKCEATLTYTHIDVVSGDWVRACAEAGAFIPVDDTYRVRSEVIEDRRAQHRREKAAMRKKRERELKEEQEREEARKVALEALMEAERSTLDKSQREDTQLTLLSHFTVFLHGFDPKRWRTVQSLVSRTGATVLWEWNPTATHVLVGDRPNPDYLEMLKKLQPELEETTTREMMACLVDNTVPRRKRRRMGGDDTKTHDENSSEEANQMHAKDSFKPNETTTDPSGSAIAGSGVPGSSSGMPKTSRPGTDLPPLAPPTSSKHGNQPVRPEDLHASSRAPTRLRPQKVLSFDYSKALICVSRYVGSERQRVEVLAKQLGGRFTDRLTRRNPAVTLLISLDLVGPKCIKAREWGIPIYSLEWLEGEARTKAEQDNAQSFSVTSTSNNNSK